MFSNLLQVHLLEGSSNIATLSFTAARQNAHKDILWHRTKYAKMKKETQKIIATSTSTMQIIAIGDKREKQTRQPQEDTITTRYKNWSQKQ